MNVRDRYFPVTAAYTGKSCTGCCAGPTGSENLLRCGSCKLVCYCSKTCQKTDWKQHKAECKVLKLFKEKYASIPVPESNRQAKMMVFFKTIKNVIQKMGGEDKNLPTAAQLEMLSNDRFTKFVVSGRVCSICLKNEFSGAAEANKIDWQCCPDCNFGWCCSPEHWEGYKGQHTPEICGLYQNSCRIELFHYQHAMKFNEEFQNVPQTELQEALENFPKDWDAYFRIRFADMYPQLLPRLPPNFFAASTKKLSPPVTCLAAMYKFGISHFVNDNKGGDLTINVVGADCYEIPATMVWEEISHCLPQVKNLTIQFVGPNSTQMINGQPTEYETLPVESVCPDCTANQRNRLVGMVASTYHDYEREYLSTAKHSKPDLIVAFNTGMFEEETESWKTSLKVILDMNVPAYFTSYSRDEGDKDFELLQGMNANILQKGPEQNPFAEQFMLIEPTTEHGVDRFYANNMYGVLFQGKKD